MRFLSRIEHSTAGSRSDDSPCELAATKTADTEHAAIITHPSHELIRLAPSEDFRFGLRMDPNLCEIV